MVAKLDETNEVLAARVAAAQREQQLEMRRPKRIRHRGGEPEDDADAQPSW